ncbi:MAG: hypothetical protein AAGA90_07895 [Actinomycetota bacterium]
MPKNSDATTGEVADDVAQAKPPEPPGQLALAWASTVYALYAADRIDARHESAITQGALLSDLLDRSPRHDHAPKWWTELRQVRRELIGDEEDVPDGNLTPAEVLAGAIAGLTARR